MPTRSAAKGLQNLECRSLRTFSDKDLIAVRVAADKVLVDEEKRRVVLHEGSPPFAAAVAAGPGTGCGERRPLPCRRLLSCRVRRGNCGFGRAVAGGSLVCGVSGRAAARTSGQQESREDGRCDKSGVFHRGHCRGASQNFRYLSSFRCICALVRGVLSPCAQRCSTPPYWRALSATVSTSMKMSPETIRAPLRSL